MNNEEEIHNIAIWGTGAYAKIFLNDIKMCKSIINQYFPNEKIVLNYFIDNNSHLKNQKFDIWEIKDGNQLTFNVLKRDHILIIIATPLYYEEIANQLKIKGLIENRDFIDCRLYFTFLANQILKINDDLKKDFYLDLLSKIKNTYRQDRLLNQRLSGIYYELGQLLIQTEEQKFQGVIYILEAYNFKYREKEIYEFLKSKFYDTFMLDMKKMYHSNLDILKNNDEFFTPLPEFDSLSIFLLKISDCQYVVYDKKTKIFEIVSRLSEDKFYIYVILLCKKLQSNLIDNVFMEKFSWFRKRELSYFMQNRIDVLLNERNTSAELLLLIEEYGEKFTKSYQYYWMLGMYYYNKKDFWEAKKYAELGHKEKNLNLKLCRLLGDVYYQLNLYSLAVQFFLLSQMETLQSILVPDFDCSKYEKLCACIREKVGKCLFKAQKISAEYETEILQVLGESFTNYRQFPLTVIVSYHNGKLNFKTDIPMGRNIVSFGEKNKFFLGILGDDTEQTEYLSAINRILFKKYFLNLNKGILWDVMRGREYKEFYLKTETECLLPVMFTDQKQTIEISYDGKKYTYPIKEQAFKRFDAFTVKYLKIKKEIAIISDKNFVVANPINFNRGKKRKIIVNLLVDSLAFNQLIQDRQWFLKSNIQKFFSKGVSFSYNYSPAEWTIASVPSIYTGVYQSKTQIFHPAIPMSLKLDCNWKTIADHMSEIGFYCINLSTTLNAFLYNGVYRGFDRSIGDVSATKKQLIFQAIDFMETFQENDLYLNLHLMDIHEAGFKLKSSMTTDSKIDLGRILDFDMEQKSKSKSIHVHPSDLRKDFYNNEMINTDEILGILFDYIEKHYNENDFIVSLCADHGVGFFEKSEFMLKNGVTKVPLMVRGQRVKPAGAVLNEVTNTLDLYSIYAHLCNYEISQDVDSKLPKFFGGEGREYSVCNSLYPGQTYKMVIYSLDYEFHLETKNLVSLDGQIDMGSFTCKLYDRKQGMNLITDKRILNIFIKVAHEHTKSLCREFV